MDKVNVMFRMLSDNLIPDFCTATLKVIPTTCYSKGDIYEIPKVGSRARSTGCWCYCSEQHVVSGDIEEHLKHVVDCFSGLRHELEQLVAEQNIRRSISFWWESPNEHGGFTLPNYYISLANMICDDMQFQFILNQELK